MRDSQGVLRHEQRGDCRASSEERVSDCWCVASWLRVALSSLCGPSNRVLSKQLSAPLGLAILTRCRRSAGGDGRPLGESVSWDYGCCDRQRFDNHLQRSCDWQSLRVSPKVDCDLADVAACRRNRFIPNLPKQEAECARSTCFVGARLVHRMGSYRCPAWRDRTRSWHRMHPLGVGL